MYVRRGTPADELQASVVAGVEIANVLSAGGSVGEVRRILVDAGFVRAPTATDAEITDLIGRIGPVCDLLESIPEAPLDVTVERTNLLIGDLPVRPAVVAHDGAPLHIHWTPAGIDIGTQVAADVLMGVLQSLCDSGSERFGRCAARQCGRLFVDTTRNRSRRFCSDPRCASRTHTAHHRSRTAGAGTVGGGDTVTA